MVYFAWLFFILSINYRSSPYISIVCTYKNKFFYQQFYVQELFLEDFQKETKKTSDGAQTRPLLTCFFMFSLKSKDIVALTDLDYFRKEEGNKKPKTELSGF